MSESSKKIEWHDNDKTPEDGDRVICTIEGGGVFEGVYNSEEHELRHTEDGCGQRIGWQYVDLWTYRPTSEKDTLGHKIEEVFGTKWEDVSNPGTGVQTWRNGKWVIKARPELLTFYREGNCVYLEVQVDLDHTDRPTKQDVQDLHMEVENVFTVLEELLYNSPVPTHEGINLHRLSGAEYNDSAQMLENRFHEEWKKKAPNMMGFLMSRNSMKAHYSARDATVAATIIQWLGTPVGQSFLRECGFEFVGR